MHEDSGMAHGRSLREALRRVGSPRQLASCEAYTVSDGSDAGTRRIRVAADGIDIELLPDRGLDIGSARVDGVPVAWLSPTGFPPRSTTDGAEFTRTFGGGLLTTCGLQNFGPESEDGGAVHPMHGRMTAQRARVVRAEVVSDPDENQSAGAAAVEAVILETDAFGTNLELRRSIELPLGERCIRIRDRIVNRGAAAAECMVLYHANFGWPLVDEGTELRTGAERVIPRDAAAEAGFDTWQRFPALAEDYPEQVFSHVLPRDSAADVIVEHPSGFSARIRYDTSQLPGLFEWRVSRPGCVVLGVEPASAPTILGRADARERGLLREVRPGGSLEFALEIAFEGHYRPSSPNRDLTTLSSDTMMNTRHRNEAM